MRKYFDTLSGEFGDTGFLISWHAVVMPMGERDPRQHQLIAIVQHQARQPLDHCLDSHMLAHQVAAMYSYEYGYEG